MVTFRIHQPDARETCTFIVTTFFASQNNWHVSFSCSWKYPKFYHLLQTWCLLVNVSTTRWNWSGQKLKNSGSCLLNIQHLHQHEVSWSVLCRVFIWQTAIVWNSNFLDWIPRAFCLCLIRIQWYSSKFESRHVNFVDTGSTRYCSQPPLQPGTPTSASWQLSVFSVNDNGCNSISFGINSHLNVLLHYGYIISSYSHDALANILRGCFTSIGGGGMIAAVSVKCPRGKWARLIGIKP